MDIAYHIRLFLHDLTRSVGDETEVMFVAFIACAVLLHRVLSRNRSVLR